jgi:hypothetical protein
MTGVEFSRREVESLVSKLDELELSEVERELLLAIFWAAGDCVSPVRPHAAGEQAERRKQLIHSFLPDTGNEFLILQIRHGPFPRQLYHPEL